MSFPAGFIGRGGFFQPRESSRLQSFREPGSIPRAWQAAAPRYQQSNNFTNQVATLRRQVNAIPAPRLNSSQMHPFKIYNFPRSMRYFQNNDDWRRVKVRSGFVEFWSGNIATPGFVWGTDRIGATISNAGALTDDVFLGQEQTPPKNASSIAFQWNEIVLPVGNTLVAIWISLVAPTAPAICWANYSDMASSFTATSLYDGSTFTEHWPDWTKDDPFHRIIGYVEAFDNGQVAITQLLTSNVFLPYYSITNSVDQSYGPMAYRGLYNSSDYYWPGNVVKVDDGNFIYEYIFSPTTVDGYAWTYSQGPLTAVDPPAAPWVLFSKSPKGHWAVIGGNNLLVHD